MNNIEYLLGRRIHIAGSADPSIDPKILSFTQNIVKEISLKTFRNSGGFVVSIGNDPTNVHDPTLPIIFDWTILETIDKYQKSNEVSWPEGKGTAIVAVGLPKWRSKIPVTRLPLWDSISSSVNFQLVQVRSELGVGGILREEQARYGDILVTIGGGPGVSHLAELYFSKKKPVIPLDLPLKGDKGSASQSLYRRAMEDPSLFFECETDGNAARALSRISHQNDLDILEYTNRFFDILSILKKPTAFYVRLLNEDVPEFIIVENYFRNVVDEVIGQCGYDRFESGLDASKDPFLNLEIFHNLHFSSLAIVDLTGIRPNCCLELGYALGQKKKVILMAQNGTRLPFDTKMIPCYFWSAKSSYEDRIRELSEFMERNIDRRPIVQ